MRLFEDGADLLHLGRRILGDEAAAEQLWRVSQALTGVTYPL